MLDRVLPRPWLADGGELTVVPPPVLRCHAVVGRLPVLRKSAGEQRIRMRVTTTESSSEPAQPRRLPKKKNAGSFYPLPAGTTSPGGVQGQVAQRSRLSVAADVLGTGTPAHWAERQSAPAATAPRPG